MFNLEQKYILKTIINHKELSFLFAFLAYFEFCVYYGSGEFSWLKAMTLEANVVKIDELHAFVLLLLKQALISDLFSLFAHTARPKFLWLLLGFGLLLVHERLDDIF
jgi:hypothetical protein